MTPGVSILHFPSFSKTLEGNDNTTWHLRMCLEILHDFQKFVVNLRLVTEFLLYLFQVFQCIVEVALYWWLLTLEFRRIHRLADPVRTDVETLSVQKSPMTHYSNLPSMTCDRVPSRCSTIRASSSWMISFYAPHIIRLEHSFAGTLLHFDQSFRRTMLSSPFSLF